MSKVPLVTVLIPARDEAADIVACVAAVAMQDYPVERIEVVVVDGASTDGTSEVARQAIEGRGFAHTAVLRNLEATTPSNLNVGLRYATGEIICRVDARTRIEPHYVQRCVTVLTERPEVAVVGGAQRALARDQSAKAVGIARALNNRYSMGGSPYRRAVSSGPSDTVYLGAFRRADLLAIRGWDERLSTNQDFDVNRRMAGRGRVWFDASLRSGYVPRSSLLLLWHQYMRFGRAKVGYWRASGDRPLPRQRIMLLSPAVLAVTALGLLATGGSTPVALLVVSCVILVVVDAVGVGGRPPIVARLWAMAATAIVSAAWWLGVTREATLRR